MECPDCHYVLDPFETECPRCKRAGKPSKTEATPAVTPPPVASMPSTPAPNLEPPPTDKPIGAVFGMPAPETPPPAPRPVESPPSAHAPMPAAPPASATPPPVTPVMNIAPPMPAPSPSPHPMSVSEGEPFVLYEYHMVQLAPKVVVSEQNKQGNEAADYLMQIANHYAAQGWEFFRIDTFAVQTNPQQGCGCLALFSPPKQATVEEVYVMTLRRPRR